MADTHTKIDCVRWEDGEVYDINLPRTATPHITALGVDEKILTGDDNLPESGYTIINNGTVKVKPASTETKPQLDLLSANQNSTAKISAEVKSQNADGYIVSDNATLTLKSLGVDRGGNPVYNTFTVSADYDGTQHIGDFLENGTGKQALKQKPESGKVVKMTSAKNPHALALDATYGNDNPVEAKGDFSAVFGSASIATGKRAFAQGTNTFAKGNYSHSEGDNAVAHGTESHAEGYNTLAEGNQSHAEGSNTISKGLSSHAEGIDTVAGGKYSHSEGNQSKAGGEGSHSEGIKTEAAGYYSHAEGDNSKVLTALPADGGTSGGSAGGDPSGETWKASEHLGQKGHAEGTNNLVLGYSAHAEGYNTKAYGPISHAEGYNTVAGTKADLEKGWCAHASGRDTVAEANCSFTSGLGTVANTEFQTVIGRYNKVEDSLFTVGCGTSNSDRKNAFAINIDGTIKLGEVTATSVTFTTANPKLIFDGTIQTAGGLIVGSSSTNQIADAGHIYADDLQITTISSNTDDPVKTDALAVYGKVNVVSTDDEATGLGEITSAGGITSAGTVSGNRLFSNTGIENRGDLDNRYGKITAQSIESTKPCMSAAVGASAAEASMDNSASILFTGVAGQNKNTFTCADHADNYYKNIFTGFCSLSVEYIRTNSSATVFRYQLPGIMYFPENNIQTISLQLPLIGTDVQNCGGTVTPFASCLITFDSATRKPTLNIHVANTASAITKVSTLPFYRGSDGTFTEVGKIKINILKFD